MSTFGYETIGATPSADWANYKAVDKFALSEDGDISKLTAALANGASACHAKAIIYSDSAGSPDALIATGAEVAIADSQAEGWVDFPMASVVSLDAGTYWLGVIGDASAGALSLRREDAGGSFGYAADTYADGASDPCGALSGTSGLLSIYATYEPVVVVPNDPARDLVTTDIDDSLWQILVGHDEVMSEPGPEDIVLPTGGTITTDGDYTVHKFTSGGTLAVPSGFSVDAEVLVVGGGGGGSRGGGGAGGYLAGTETLSGDMTVVVGAGGAAGHGDGPVGGDGADSSFGTLTADGGGGGGYQTDGVAGGSGGGGGANSATLTSGGAGTAGQGYAGGGSGYTASPYPSGGGGGAGAQGQTSPSASQSGNGGAGLDNAITGISVGYAGGGGGACYLTGGGGAATHGGGAGATGGGTAGTANTGGGGGGAGNTKTGGAGGSGIVVVRYLTADFTPEPEVLREAQWRDVTDEVGGLVYSNVRPGGAASCSFTLPADVWGIGYNELKADSRLIVRYAGRVVWDGFILPRGVAYGEDG